MKLLKLATQVVFYLVILTLLVSSSVSAVISHDENQFIAPGQLLAYHGLVPYVDYPYTHMPYGTIFYAISAWVSEFDLLAGRLMSSMAWLGCIALMVAISRALGAGPDTASSGAVSWKRLLWEFVLVYVFIQHGPVLFVLRTALNHSLATLLSLLAAWFFVRGMRVQGPSNRAAFLSGACIAAAGLVRFNYASLAMVLLVCWLIHASRLGRAERWPLMLRFTGGAVTAGLPTVVLAVLAPREFYYGNLVYIRLNTIYYQELLRTSGMGLASKLEAFVANILVQPLDMLLYAVLVFTGVECIVQLVRGRSTLDIARLGIAGIAAALWLSAFAPTPALLHYFAAPIPFLFILLAAFEVRTSRFDGPAHVLGVLVVLVAAVSTITLKNPLDALAVLSDPSQWPPVQLHELAVSVNKHIAVGKVLTLQPMVPLEAGLDVYPFTATGPFSWRTSLLLTPQRRLEYDVTSPEELPGLLAHSPPDAILVGFEAPNAGFGFQDLGGLETPLSEYALGNGYRPVALSMPFWPRGLTLWIRP